METKNKIIYAPPMAETVEVKAEGVICESGLRGSYGNANDDGIDPSELDGNGVWNW